SFAIWLLHRAPNGRTCAMEFGMFHQFPAIPGRTQKEAFAEAFEQIDAAERWGLDAMWLAELHFDPQRSVLSAPLSIAAAVGERTLPIFINARYGSFAEFAPEIQAYRQAYAAAGHEGRGQVYLRVPAYLAETEEQARAEPRESLMHFYHEQAQRLRASLSR